MVFFSSFFFLRLSAVVLYIIFIDASSVVSVFINSWPILGSSSSLFVCDFVVDAWSFFRSYLTFVVVVDNGCLWSWSCLVTATVTFDVFASFYSALNIVVFVVSVTILVRAVIVTIIIIIVFVTIIIVVFVIIIIFFVVAIIIVIVVTSIIIVIIVTTIILIKIIILFVVVLSVVGIMMIIF